MKEGVGNIPDLHFQRFDIVQRELRAFHLRRHGYDFHRIEPIVSRCHHAFHETLELKTAAAGKQPVAVGKVHIP